MCIRAREGKRTEEKKGSMEGGSAGGGTEGGDDGGREGGREGHARQGRRQDLTHRCLLLDALAEVQAPQDSRLLPIDGFLANRGVCHHHRPKATTNPQMFRALCLL